MLRRCLRRAFTLPEIMIASIVMAILLGGLLAIVIQSRKLTDGSVVQNAVVSVVQGYLEQMKNMDWIALNISPAAAGTTITVPTELDETTPSPLTLSWGSPPTSMPAVGTTPTGAIDNIKVIQLKTPATAPADTVSINVWIWVKDLTGTATNVTNAKSITMIYTYQFRNGAQLRSFRSSVRSVRSIVPSF